MNQFNARKSTLALAIRKSLEMIPALTESVPLPWPINPPKIFKLKAHPLGKFLSTESNGVVPFRIHSRDQWIAYANALVKHDFMTSSVPEYNKFCTLFRYIPQVNDMIFMRIYVELYSLLMGMEYGSLRDKQPGYSYQHIVDEINNLRRRRNLTPAMDISGRFLVKLILQSPEWMSMKFPSSHPSSAVNDDYKTYTRCNKPYRLESDGSPLDIIPPDLRNLVRKFLPQDERCKVSLIPNPFPSINIDRVSRLLNSSSIMLVQTAITHSKTLVIAQCIANGACLWLDHLDVYNLYIATMLCVTRVHRVPPSPALFSPLLTPLPSSLITDCLMVTDSNEITAKFPDNYGIDYRSVLNNKWDHPFGSTNRVIGGSGVLLVRGDKKHLELIHNDAEKNDPPQLPMVRLPWLSWVRPYPQFNSDQNVIEVLANN